MTKPLKIAVMILVISGGLLGSYWIIQDAKQTTGETVGFSLEDAVKPGGTLFKYIEEAVQEIQEFQEIIKNEEVDSSNLTEIIAKAIAGKILEENKSGLAKTEEGELKLLMPDEETLLQELTNQLTNLNTGLLNLNQSINENDLKISQDNSLEAQNKYLEGIQIIAQTHFRDFNQDIPDILERIVSTGDSTQVKKLSEIYKSIIEDYLLLDVPLGWLDFHKKALIHFQNAVIIYSALADFQNDPLKAYLAIEAWFQLPEDAQEIQGILEQKVKEMGYN